MVSRGFIAAFLVAVLALVGGVAALRQRSGPVQGGASPRVAEAERHAPRPEVAPVGWLGVLITEESLDVASRLDARVESIKVQVGSVVRQGDLLVKLDSKSLEEDLAIAEAALLSSKAELDVARLSMEEAQERLRRRESPEQLKLGALSEEELSAVRYEQRMASAKLEVARAKVVEQEVRVIQLRQKVVEASLRAPFDGVVSGRFVHPTALVRAGQPILHLLRRGKPQVRFAIPSQELGSLAVGQGVRVEVAERGLKLSGRVTQVAPEVDVVTQMIFALADLELAGAPPVPTGTAVRVGVADLHARSASP